MKNNLLFLWIPKTGGTSFYEAMNKSNSFVKELSCNKISSGTHGHIKLDMIYSQEELLSFDIVTIVRNPYSRFLSLYRYLQKIGRFDKSKSILEFIKTIRHGIDPISSYNSKLLSQCNPQTHWTDGIPGITIWMTENIDLLFRFYNIPLVHMNSSTKPQDDSLLTREVIDFINEYYDSDFIEFGYTKK